MRTAAIIFGIILLLPGICSLGFMLASLPSFHLSDASFLIPLWAIGFAISAFGIWLLRNGGKPK